MAWYEALILGLVQGLAEFLPISSSGHLLLVREFFSLSGNYLVFDVMLHVATLFAIFLAFYKELFALFKPPFKTLGLIILASIPAVIVGALFSFLNIDIFDNVKYICFFFLVSSVLMFFAEYLGKRVKEPKEVNLKIAMCMGLMQSVGVLPGVTRSGSTIFGGIAAKGGREGVAKFSFFMSIPIILGAAVVSLFGSDKGMPVDWYNYLIGMITAFVSGFFAIKFMLRLIGKANFKWFSLYLLVLSIATFIAYFI